MTPDEEGIGLDDISFDDVLDGGSAEVPSDLAIDAPEAEADELDADAEELQEEESNEEEEFEEDEDLEEDEEEEDDDEEVEREGSTVVSEILEKLGYDTEEEYDDTTEGLLAMTQDVGKQMAEDQLDGLFENFPLVKNHLEYVLNGGDSQDFMQAYDPNLDYNKVELAEDDVRSQKAILSDYFTTKGHDKEFIDELLEDYQDNGKLLDKATAAKNALAKSQETQRSQLVEQRKAQRAEETKQQQNFWNGVHETIENSDEFAGVNVPKRESELETKLAIDYLMFKGFDLSKIVETKAKSKNAKSLRDRISKNEERVKSARKASRRTSKQVDLDDLDLNF